MEVIAENRLGDPVVQGIVLSMRDFSVRKALEDELRHQAFHDALTGLANRALFEDRLTLALAGARRQEHSFAVLFLDLDEFKAINDAFGHSRGDELLRDVAMRIGEIIRPTDTAARLGGDEFAVLVEALENDGDAYEVAQRILAALAWSFVLDGHELRVTASVGMAICDGSETIEDVLRRADMAMYSAKREGKAAMRTFDPARHLREGKPLELS
jgi:diguanylate cyclase (GGDEF)-like protein